MWEAVQLHPCQDQVLRSLRNTNVPQIQQMFTTGNQIADLQADELSGLHVKLSWEESPLRSCTLLHEDMYKQFTAHVYDLIGFRAVSWRKAVQVS